MSRSIPDNIMIYHIAHLDRLRSIVNEGCLWSDEAVQSKGLGGTMIGIEKIKKRRMTNKLHSHINLTVGQCVPFYFCPRSVMLFVIRKNNIEGISYHGGQNSIIHLQAKMNTVIDWAKKHDKRWAFTDSNAGSEYFNDYSSLEDLDKIDWDAVNKTYWTECIDEKQAEFLLEERLPWSLIEAIGVYSSTEYQAVNTILKSISHRPPTSIQEAWYY